MVEETAKKPRKTKAAKEEAATTTRRPFLTNAGRLDLSDLAAKHEGVSLLGGEAGGAATGPAASGGGGGMALPPAVEFANRISEADPHAIVSLPQMTAMMGGPSKPFKSKLIGRFEEDLATKLAGQAPSFGSKRPAGAGAEGAAPPKKKAAVEKPPTDDHLANLQTIRNLQKVAEQHQVDAPRLRPEQLAALNPRAAEAHLEALRAAMDSHGFDVTIGRTAFNSLMDGLGRLMGAAGAPIRQHPEAGNCQLSSWVGCEPAAEANATDTRKRITYLVDRFTAERMGTGLSPGLTLLALVGYGISQAVDVGAMRARAATAVVHKAAKATPSVGEKEISEYETMRAEMGLPPD